MNMIQILFILGTELFQSSKWEICLEPEQEPTGATLSCLESKPEPTQLGRSRSQPKSVGYKNPAWNFCFFN